MSIAPLLSIVTVTMDDYVGFAATLESITRQMIAPDVFECIVVDGGCDERIRALVMAAPRMQVQLISEPDDGVYDAMNKGWRQAQGSYVQFLNSGDTLASPHALAQQLAILASKPVWAVFGAMHLNGGQGPIVRIENLPHAWWRHCLGLQVHCHQATILRRDLIDDLDGYSLDFDMVADFDLILRLGLISRPKQCPEVTVNYLGGGMSSRSAEKLPELMGRCRESRLQLSGAARLANQLWIQYKRLRFLLASMRSRVGRRSG